MSRQVGWTNKPISVAVELKHETDMAYLVDAGFGAYWVPKAKAEYDPDTKELTLPEWLAIERSLI